MEKARKENGIALQEHSNQRNLHTFQQIKLYSAQLTMNYIPIG